MPESVDPAVEELRGSSSSDPVRLLVGASGDRDDLRATLARFDVTVQDEISRSALLVYANESSVDELCELDGVSSIELDDEDVEALGEETLNTWKSLESLDE